MNDEIKAVRIDIGRCFRALFRKFYIVILGILIFTGIGVLVTNNTKSQDIFAAKASVYSASYGSYAASIQGGNAMVTYSDVVKSKKVCNRAALLVGDSSISTEMIQSMVSVSVPEDGNSYILNIVASSSNPGYCVKVANAVAEAFVLEMSSITGSTVVQILDQAENCYIAKQSESGMKTTLLLYAVAGLVFTCVLIVLPILFTKKVISVDECTMNGRIELLGIIPRY